MTVRRRLCNNLTADNAAGAAAVVDNDLAAPALGKFLRDVTAAQIRGAAR